MNFQLMLKLKKIDLSVLSEETIYERYEFSNIEVGRKILCQNRSNGMFLKILEVKLSQ